MPRCGAKWRKPVSAITDRQKRHRANHPDCKPKGKRCVKCGSTRNLVVGHKDGDESNGAKSNLQTECKSCNTRDGKAMAKAGKGVRTRQYNPKKKKRRNPGAQTLGAYVDAAVNHTRGSHDAGGKVIHETPKAKRREFAREIAFRKGYSKNPSAADELYRKFHGRGPDKITTTLVAGMDPYGGHPELTSLGPLIRLVIGEDVELTSEGEVSRADWVNELTFIPSMREYRSITARLDSKNNDDLRKFKAWLKSAGAPDVAAVPNTRQLYFVGGNQFADDKRLIALGVDPEKDLCDLGFCYLIEYFAQKRFDQFEPTTYFHGFGERTGVQPRLIYRKPQRMLELVGGEYVVKSVGIDN
jgi:hypothetical protein